MPAFTALVTAASSVVLALPPRLMLATAGLTALAVTQSMPLITVEVLPEPVQSSTLTPVSATAGAMPTTSAVLSRAPMVPDTWVPWPLQSVFLPSPVKFTWLILFNSPWGAIPVSITYTLTVLTVPEPSPARVEDRVARVVEMPHGMVWAVVCMGRSSSMLRTVGSALRRATWASLRAAAKPLMTLL